MNPLLISFFTLLLLTGCATSKDELLPHDSNTMDEIWRQSPGASASSPTLNEARMILRRPLNDREIAQAVAAQQIYSRQAQTEITALFRRLPNPDLVMYVFPHLTGGQPVPGYSTVFPLYQQVVYALPGERVSEDK